MGDVLFIYVIVCPLQKVEQLKAEYTNWSVIKPSLAYQPQS